MVVVVVEEVLMGYLASMLGYRYQGQGRWEYQGQKHMAATSSLSS